MIRNYTYLLFLLFLGLSQTSVQAQALRGAVLDKNTLQPLPGAELVFYYTSNDRVVAQMGDSEFRIEAPRPGVGWLTVQASGYQSFTILEIQLVAGKERVLEVLLSPMELPEAALTCVDIVESRPFRDRSPIGELPLSREQTLNYPMTYFDPARLAAMAPGVVQTDDGTNSMSIRGNNPSWVRWRLQGLDVVNPNHLPNAGTFSDRPSLSSGGVLMLSAQMIDHSALITGAGSVGYNDGVAGMMDLQLRKGNNQQHEQTIQAGLIGMDISAEGPLSKKKKGASYLFNYRYSTVGILGKLGVSFGGEQITFQDLALHLNFPFRKKDYLSVFVLAGNSENLFTPPDSVAVYKDQFKIDFTSRTGIGGATYYGFVGDEFSYKIGTAFSTQENSRSQVSSAFLQSDLQDQGRFSLHFSGKLRASNRLSWLMGAQSTAYLLRNLSRVEDDLFVSIYSSQLTQQVTQAWLASEFSLLGGRLQATAGINPIGTPLRYSLDPRLQLAWRPASAHQVVFSAAAYSQFDAQWRASINGDLIHARNLGLRYRFQPEVQWEFSAEAFHQQVTNIVVDGLTRDAYSHFNETETLDLSSPVRNGKAFNTTSDYIKFLDTLSSKDRPPEWLNKIVLKLLTVNERIDSKQSFTELLSENFMHNLPKMIFLLLPFLALWMKILYFRRGVPYMQHLILMIQSYNLLFLLATIVLLIEMIPGVGDIMTWLLWILVIHFTLSLRFVFHQSWMKTILKSFAFFWGMIIMLGMGAAVNTLYSILSM